ncbi:MAG: hypothetical protein AMXMBFR84_43770 [Candidatus Hydrogenedentota bacterium]
MVWAAATLSVCSSFASADISYHFERIIPSVPKAWDLNSLIAIDIDEEGKAYLIKSDGLANIAQVLKYDRDGRLVTTWGSVGVGAGQFTSPHDVAADAHGYVYVLEANRVQKFTDDGIFVTSWGGTGALEGQFQTARGIAVDGVGNVYVADTGNNRIQVFDADGIFQRAWGSGGGDDGQFNQPTSLCVDDAGNVFVVDRVNDRIQKFSSDGTHLGTAGGINDPLSIDCDALGAVYVVDFFAANIQVFENNLVARTTIGASGTTSGNLESPCCIAVSRDSIAFVADQVVPGVHIFQENGQFLGKWNTASGDLGDFLNPLDVHIGPNGKLYVADSGVFRLQQLTMGGIPEAAVGAFGVNAGQFITVNAVAAEENSLGNLIIYVLDETQNKVQAFQENLTSFYQFSDTLDLPNPVDLVADSTGDILVLDGTNSYILKYQTSTATAFIPPAQLNPPIGLGPGAGNGQFQSPSGMGIDSSNNIYVADTGNERIQKLNAAGAFVAAYPKPITGTWEPIDVTVDAEGNMIVSLLDPAGIDVLSPTGTLVASLRGEDIFQRGLAGVDVDSDGNIYFADSGRGAVHKYAKADSSLAKFARVAAPPAVNKAVIVSGGGPFDGNFLWDATQVSANAAYWTLLYQGFPKDNIQYLSPVTDTDVDGNGANDDVDAFGSVANIQAAIETWAAGPEEVENVTIYLVDHGGTQSFRANPSEILNASDLALWLDTLQEEISGTLTVVYDACEAGSFLSTLASATYSDRRIVIASTTPGQEAYFVTGGVISFSGIFWMDILNGVSVANAFDAAAGVLDTLDQSPVIDDNGDGVGSEDTAGSDGSLASDTYITTSVTGLGIPQFWAAPNISGVTITPPSPGSSTGTIDVGSVQIGSGHVARVWAVIRPPEVVKPATTIPVTKLPTAELRRTMVLNEWEGTFRGFTTEGEYDITIHAIDDNGIPAIPFNTSIIVGGPPRRRVLIVGGGATSDPDRTAIDNLTVGAYNALRFQGVADADIQFLSQASGGPVDDLASVANIENAVTTWAGTNTQDLVLYFVGPGLPAGFDVNGSDFLNWSDLDGWLDTLQATLPGTVVVIADTPASGAILPVMTPPAGRTRILVSSANAGQDAIFAGAGVISFSKLFWAHIALGESVGSAFQVSAPAVEIVSGQTAMLDDSADGTYDTKDDGALAALYFIGGGIGYSGDEPVIGDWMEDEVLSSPSVIEIWADPVTSLLTLDGAIAVITPPNGEAVEIVLNPDGEARFSNTYNFDSFGVYGIDIRAFDTRGASSLPATATVYFPNPAGVTPDAYEEDNAPASARWIGVDAFPDQQHNFHEDGDQDWVEFFAASGETVTIETNALGINCDTLVELFQSDGTTLLADNDDRGPSNRSSRVVYPVTANGNYRIRVSKSPAATVTGYGEGSEYSLRVWHETGPDLPGSLIVTVMNDLGVPVPGAQIELTSNAPFWQVSQSSGVGGTYSFLGLDAGSYSVVASAAGYGPSSPTPVSIFSGSNENRQLVVQSNPGSIHCVIGPASAVAAGAQWRIDGGVFNNSGATVVASPGNRVVSFKDVPGWITPAQVNVSVTSGVTAEASGTYVAATLPTPQNVQASDGSFTDRVQITWSAVAGAGGYRVYKNTVNDSATATLLGETGDLVANDFGAQPPTVSGGGCTGPGSTNFTTYFYWIQAAAPGGLESSLSTSDSGYRGATTKLLTDMWFYDVYELALPSIPLGQGVRAVQQDEWIAVRLMSDDEVNADSVRATVNGEDLPTDRVSWVPVVKGSGGDGWVVIRPDVEWAMETDLAIEASGVDGQGFVIESDLFVFRVAMYASPVYPPLESAVSGIDPIVIEDPATPLSPVDVYVPYPGTASVGEVDLYYYVEGEGEGEGAWYPAHQVNGLDPRLGDDVVLLDGIPSIQLIVNHGGLYQWGEATESSDAPSGFVASTGIGFAGVYVLSLLLLFGCRRLFRPAHFRYR